MIRVLLGWWVILAALLTPLGIFTDAPVWVVAMMGALFGILPPLLGEIAWRCTR